MIKSAKDALAYIDTVCYMLYTSHINPISFFLNLINFVQIIFINQDRTERRQITQLNQLQYHFDCLKGSVMMGFPGGLPDYDIITHIINNTEDKSNIPVMQTYTYVILTKISCLIGNNCYLIYLYAYMCI